MGGLEFGWDARNSEGSTLCGDWYADGCLYDIKKSYEWNYENAPREVSSGFVAAMDGAWDFCGLPVNSPLGVPAGPLLNSHWILHYASLGFDVLTYKTVRSAERKCYGLPNLLPVEGGRLRGEGGEVVARDGAGFDTWAISFGMPSKDPSVWRKDVELARKGLKKKQVLVVSVVASPQAGWTVDQVAEDFALCAKWAKESGAQVVEPNLSCPNVCTQEGDLYLSPVAAGEVARAVRAAVGGLPVVLKAGLFPDSAAAGCFVDAVAPFADAISSTNSITAKVRGEDGELLFDSLKRGIGGAAIEQRCMEEIGMLGRVVREKGSSLRLVAVGGVRNAEQVKARLGAGAHHVQLATAAMLNPRVALEIRKDWLAK